jgi:uncharacterized protein DUF6603
MAKNPGTLELLAQQVGLALAPLESRLTPPNVIPLLAELGLQFPPQVFAQSAFMNAVHAGSTAAGAISAQVLKLVGDLDTGDDAAILQDGLVLVQQIRTTITVLGTIGTELSNIATALPGLDAAEVTAFAGNLASNLLGYLLITYVENVEPGFVGVANLIGVVNYVAEPGVPNDLTHPPYVRRELQLSNLQKLLTDPVGFFHSLYRWGDADFDGTQMLPRLGTSLRLLGMPVKAVDPPAVGLTAPLVTVKPNPATTPPGLLATLAYGIPGTFDLTMAMSPRFALQVQAQAMFGANLEIVVTPPANVTFSLPNATLSGLAQFALTGTGADDAHPLLIAGAIDGTRIEAKTFAIRAGITMTGDTGSGTANADPVFEASIGGGQLVVDTSDADGFLADVLSGIHVEAPFELKASWGVDTGLHVQGGAQLEIDVPLHLTLGPVTLPTLYLIGGVGSSGITVEASVALGVTLGPIQIAVDRLGGVATITFPSHGGNLGPADLQGAFKPPSGLGLAIDAGLIAGGGYIGFDPANGRYSGTLQLVLADTINVTAIAVLDTVMPDGSKGFAFLFVLTFEFPPIELGFGFTLNGVGGLGGVNRSMNVDALRAGFRAHTLGSIMFPPDPIENAPQIISDMRSFFPVAQGRYLFGPLLEIGWGTPTLLTFTIGVIVEVPDPIRIGIIGLIDGGLPTQSEELIELHLEVLGIVDFGTQTLAIDGLLYESRVAVYALNGALALRYAWGAHHNLIAALGGFNPHFDSEGLDVPELARLSVSIGDGDNPRLSASGYFALTPNTRQFGGNVEATAHAGGFGIHGYVGFDVLIVRSPFSFEADFLCSFDVTFEGHTLLGLTVDGTLSGPTPWHLHAHASISLVFFSIGKTIDHTWGDSTQVIIPPRPILPDLEAALQDTRNWNAILPPGGAVAVSLAAVKPDDAALRVHPLGTLTVRESVVPLDLTISQYAGAPPSDGTRFSIEGVALDGHDEGADPVQDYFAPAEFLTLSDADKLSAPSFESYHAGAAIGSAGASHGQDVARSVVYAERYIDDFHGNSRFSGIYHLPAATQFALSAQGAGPQSLMKHTALAKYAPAPGLPAITVHDAAYVVATATDLSVRTDILSANGTNFFAARTALRDYVLAHPAEAHALQVVPVHEAFA